MRPLHVLKGHGTGNDFVLVPDLDGEHELSPALVRALCDRHAGVGGDGVLRVVRSAKLDDGTRFAADAEFFMDYRNADGSVAEMCGNGVRVFVRYLQRVGLVGPDAAVATRGGIMRARTEHDGTISVEMGSPRILADRPVVTAAPRSGQGGRALERVGRAVEMPNPHVVVAVDDPDSLAALDLSRAPDVRPPLPAGQNVEFVVQLAPHHLRLRVHERGVGETQSCGTGICAAVAAVSSADGSGADGQPWRVDVPGGTCHVTWTPQSMTLRAAAVLVAELEVDADWLATVR